MTTPDPRQERAKQLFAAYPELFPKHQRTAILRGQVSLGMSPLEAHIAGGTFTFEVFPDSSKWSPRTDPLEILWRQSTAPDDSAITMTFSNCFQFPELGEWTFKVEFRRGRAQKITRVRRGAS